MNELTGIALLRTVIPDEFAEKLCLIAFNWRLDKFTIGDIRNSLKAMVEERLLPIDAPDIDDFLAECLNHELEPRTVRYYAMVAYMFPEPTREMYRTLSFAHFAYAHTFGDEKSMGVLQLAKDRELNTGKVPSIDWLRSALNGYIYEQNSRNFPPISDDLGNDTVQMQDKSERPIGWLSSLSYSIEFSIKHLDAVPIDSELKKKLMDLLCQVDSLLKQTIMVH